MADSKSDEQILVDPVSEEEAMGATVLPWGDGSAPSIPSIDNGSEHVS